MKVFPLPNFVQHCRLANYSPKQAVAILALAFAQMTLGLPRAFRQEPAGHKPDCVISGVPLNLPPGFTEDASAALWPTPEPTPIAHTTAFDVEAAYPTASNTWKPEEAFPLQSASLNLVEEYPTASDSFIPSTTFDLEATYPTASDMYKPEHFFPTAANTFRLETEYATASGTYNSEHTTSPTLVNFEFAHPTETPPVSVSGSVAWQAAASYGWPFRPSPPVKPQKPGVKSLPTLPY